MAIPRLSIALPVHNGENFLAQALESIAGQTFGDFLLHVSENASTDGTRDILADYAKRDRRIVIDSTGTLLSQVENINRSIVRASGQWVKIICHDDMMRSDCLAQIDGVLDLAEREHVGLISNGERHLLANGYLTDNENTDVPMLLNGRAAAVGAIAGKLAHVIPALTTATVRKSAFEGVGMFDSRYPFLGDHFCWLELMTDWNLIHIPASLTINRVHSQQSTVVLGAQMLSVKDLSSFLPDYSQRHAAILQLSFSQRMHIRLRPVSEAATKISDAWSAGRRGQAVWMLRQVPIRWLPILPLLTVRSWRKQRANLRKLKPFVPRELVQP